MAEVTKLDTSNMNHKAEQLNSSFSAKKKRKKKRKEKKRTNKVHHAVVVNLLVSTDRWPLFCHVFKTHWHFKQLLSSPYQAVVQLPCS
jgi:hypothetical protein